jgi:hypothetical protein
MSKDPAIKFNSCLALELIARHNIIGIDKPALVSFILEATDHKHSGGKKTEIEAFTIGKIIVAKALC